MIDRKQLKINAREAMAQTRPRPFWVTFAVAAITLALSVLSLFVSGQWDMLVEFYTTMDYNILMEGETISVFAWLLNLALQLMSMVLSVGYVLYAMKVRRREEASFGTVFDAFGIFFRAVWISILQRLIIMGVLLVCIIPMTMLSMLVTTTFIAVMGDMGGIIASSMMISIPVIIILYIVECAYSQAVFIMLDNPQLGCVQCLAFSRAAMRGHKWEYFKLLLSFIGWHLLSIVPFVGLWVRPYITTTQAGYYDAIMPEFMAKMQNVPIFTRTGQPPQYHVPGESGEENADDETRDDDP